MLLILFFILVSNASLFSSSFIFSTFSSFAFSSSLFSITFLSINFLSFVILSSLSFPFKIILKGFSFEDFISFSSVIKLIGLLLDKNEFPLLLLINSEKGSLYLELLFKEILTLLLFSLFLLDSVISLLIWFFCIKDKNGLSVFP